MLHMLNHNFGLGRFQFEKHNKKRQSLIDQLLFFFHGNTNRFCTTISANDNSVVEVT